MPISSKRKNMAILESNMPYADMVKAVKDGHVCGQCGGVINVAWSAKENNYILRCKNLEHNTITRHRPKSESQLEAEKEWREVNKVDTKALTTMNEKQMLARVEMARFPQELTPVDKRMLAQVAITYGFDPLMGEVSIYQGRPYVSIDGRYRMAQETGDLDGVQSRPATKAEREEWSIPEGDYFFRAEVYVKGSSRPFVGWGRVYKSETIGGKGYKPVEKNPQRMAEKRAEAQALRKAFHIPLPSIEDIGSPEDVGEVVVSRVIEKTTGEIVDVPEAPEQPSVETPLQSKSEGDKAQVSSPAPPRPKRDPSTIKSITDLMYACNQDFKLQPKQVLAELNYKSQSEIVDPAECYLQISSVR